MVQMIVANTALVAFACLMAWAAWCDVRNFTIPNWIPAALIAVWVVAAPVLQPGWAFAGLSLAAFAGVLAAGLALWAPGWLGGGDVKLIAAGALWFGWPDALAFLLYAMAAGGVLALVLMGLRRLGPILPVSAHALGKTALAQGAPAPYAVAIAAGALLLLPSSMIFAAYQA
ncbi:MAG: prepilin peptidase [Oceanicaulis sp.]